MEYYIDQGVKRVHSFYWPEMVQPIGFKARPETQCRKENVMGQVIGACISHHRWPKGKKINSLWMAI